MEEGRFPTIAFRKNDLIEKSDTRIIGAFGLSFMNELVETYMELVLGGRLKIANE
jgi:hypothetical protein